MRDEEIFNRVLSVSLPRFIDRLVVDQSNQRLDIWLGHQPGALWVCSECEQIGPVRDHAPQRRWRHLDCCRLETYRYARVPRIKCPSHGIRQSPVPWAAPDSRFTYPFERWAGSLADESRVSTVATMLGLSWDEANGIFVRWNGRRSTHKQRLLQTG